MSKKTRNKITTFLSDGITEKDFMVVISVTTFFLFIWIGAIMTLFGFDLPTDLMTLLDLAAEPLMVIATGLFANSVADTIMSNRQPKQIEVEVKENKEEDEGII